MAAKGRKTTRPCRPPDLRCVRFLITPIPIGDDIGLEVEMIISAETTYAMITSHARDTGATVSSFRRS
jgi:hypothetical protein